ncbi:MAG TPA: hypothetical protein VKO20_06260, partial [Desulfosalsimonadaceae bacterium]|nr:hypothetical protein [Desulfosalsimonadaceae bacterium]
MSFILGIPGVCPRGHWRALLIALGEAQPKRAGLFEPKASFQGAAEQALEIAQGATGLGANTGDGLTKQTIAFRFYEAIRDQRAGGFMENTDTCQIK